MVCLCVWDGEGRANAKVIHVPATVCQRPGVTRRRKEIRRRFRFFHISSLESMLTGGILAWKRIRLENVKHATSFNDLQTFAKTWSSGRLLVQYWKIHVFFWRRSTQDFLEGGGDIGTATNMKVGLSTGQAPLEGQALLKQDKVGLRQETPRAKCRK